MGTDQTAANYQAWLIVLLDNDHFLVEIDTESSYLLPNV